MRTASACVPHVEKEPAARLQDAARLAVSPNLVGKEHRAELAGHDVEASVRERQGEGVGLPPGDPAIAGLPRRGMIEHRLIEIGCDDPGLRRQPRCERSRQDTRARRQFQHVPGLDPGQPPGEVERV
jgi:hypothetical protein